MFNNLNILDQLIEEDKDKASAFLNEFAEIYRYVLAFSDQKLIPIADELEFIQRYFNIIKHKYGEAYTLEIAQHKIVGFIVPLTLQLLIENAVQHNLGQAEKPIHIKLVLDKEITVSNNMVPKRIKKPHSGRGLKNLKEQYAFLSAQQLKIWQSAEEFVVTIPVILNAK